MKSILIIDDDEVIRAVFGVALTRNGYRVATAADGAAGLEIARRERPDLILCDINMPGLDGAAVLQAVRREERLHASQFVFMTGNPNAMTPRTGMELGADDFLLKPFGIEELTRCISARLQRAGVHWRVDDRLVEHLRTTLRASLPHEFFTPLAGILGLVDVLRQAHATLPPEEIDALLADVERSSWRLHRTLRNYLTILETEQGETADQPAALLSVDDTRHAVSLGLESVQKRQHRAAEIQPLLAAIALRVHPKDLEIIVEELTENACAFSAPGQPVDVRLDAQGALSVTDRGRGMTREQISRIGAFAQFERKQHEQQGLGLGLALVLRLAQRNRAVFALQSEVGRGTTATVRFAVA